MKTSKASKRSVDYSPGRPRGDRCGICRHFLAAARSCELVAGEITSGMWCCLFERKPKRKGT